MLYEIGPKMCMPYIQVTNLKSKPQYLAPKHCVSKDQPASNTAPDSHPVVQELKVRASDPNAGSGYYFTPSFIATGTHRQPYRCGLGKRKAKNLL